MNIEIEYKTIEGETRRDGVDDMHTGRPLAENVRLAFKSIPDLSHAVAVYVDGEQVL